MLFILVYGFRSFSPASLAPLLLVPRLSRTCNRSHSTHEDLETKTEGEPITRYHLRQAPRDLLPIAMPPPPPKVSFISKTLSPAGDLVFSEDTHGRTLHIQITATLLPGKYMQINTPLNLPRLSYTFSLDRAKVNIMEPKVKEILCISIYSYDHITPFLLSRKGY